MKENQRLKKLLEDHFNGEPWIDVAILNSITGLIAADAARNIHGLNSIWQIVHHMTCWRETLLQRIQGKQIPSPSDNYFVPVKEVSSAAWSLAVDELKASQQQLLEYLSGDINDLESKPGEGAYSCYELLQGVLQHDAYHLGQIVLITKMLKA